MKELHLPLIEALSALLCTPERFGKLPVAEVVQLELPIPPNIELGVE